MKRNSNVNDLETVASVRYAWKTGPFMKSLINSKKFENKVNGSHLGIVETSDVFSDKGAWYMINVNLPWRLSLRR